MREVMSTLCKPVLMLRAKRFILALLLLSLSHFSIAEQSTLTPHEALDIGIAAYIYGYPLITMDMTRRMMTNVPVPDERGGAPMGEFFHLRHFLKADYRNVTSPNADVLYTIAWLDLDKEPYVLEVPDESLRYYTMNLVSGWNEVFTEISPRTNNTDHTYLIVGPFWHGKVPHDLRMIKSPTNIVWLIGRTYSSGTAEDYETVHALQDSYKLTPLSAYGKRYTPPMGKYHPEIEMEKTVFEQVNALSAQKFFNLLATLMQTNPPQPQDAPILAQIARIGVMPGKPFNLKQFSQPVIDALQKAVPLAQQKIAEHEGRAGIIKNGWVVAMKTGEYGTDYLQRAFIASTDLGANKPEDSMYPLATTDNKGERLNGKYHYVIHFERHNLPPVNAFWSLTLYDDQFFFVNNPLNRYSLSPRNSLKLGADGSLDIYIQYDSPGKAKENNWIPAPQDNFILMLRLYWPKHTVLQGTWVPPQVIKVQ